MNGAQAVLRTAERLGSTVCFTNPGTTELDFIAAFDAVPGVRPVLGLQENVCTGAADGWARITGRVGLTLLHLGAGLGNGLANLHNARRAHTPIVNLVGDHPTWHLLFDPPLASDLAGLAKAGTRLAVVSSVFADASASFLHAWDAAHRVAGPVTLIVPADDAERPGAEPAMPEWDPPDPAGPDASSVLYSMRRARWPAVLLGGSVLRGDGLVLAQRLARAVGADVWFEPFPSVLESGRGVPAFSRLPADFHGSRAALQANDCLFLVGTEDPVAFFNDAPGQSLARRPEVPAIQVCSAAHSARQVEQLVSLLPDSITPVWQHRAPDASAHERTGEAGKQITPELLAWVLVQELPEDTIVVDESNTAGLPFRQISQCAAPHLQLGSTAGVLGFGMPASIGAALGDPARRVLNLESDGSAAYTCQALWTQARERLPVTTLILCNGGYRTVRDSWRRRGGADWSVAAKALMDLDTPQIDWVAVSAGFGVDAIEVTTTHTLRTALRESFAFDGPRVIAVNIAPRSVIGATPSDGRAGSRTPGVPRTQRGA